MVIYCKSNRKGIHLCTAYRAPHKQCPTSHQCPASPHSNSTQSKLKSNLLSAQSSGISFLIFYFVQQNQSMCMPSKFAILQPNKYLFSHGSVPLSSQGFLPSLFIPHESTKTGPALRNFPALRCSHMSSHSVSFQPLLHNTALYLLQFTMLTAYLYLPTDHQLLENSPCAD